MTKESSNNKYLDCQSCPHPLACQETQQSMGWYETTVSGMIEELEREKLQVEY